jgi:hypothetical protein
MELLNIQKWVKWWKIRGEKAKGEDCTMTQQEANKLCEGPNIDAANVISNFMNMIMTCIFYSPLIPHAIPLALISTFINYWIVKYKLLRVYKMPDMFSDLMATFFSNFMPWIVLTWTLAISFFYLRTAEEWNHLITDEKKKLFSKNFSIFALVTLGISVLCIVLPLRTFINRCVDKNEVLNDEKTYDSLALVFNTDYDKENPLTIKKGQKRLLDMQISQAKENGDEETVAMLEQQKEMVAQQGAFQQMQAYTMQNQMRQMAYAQAYTPIQAGMMQSHMHAQMMAYRMQQAQMMQMQMHQAAAMGHAPPVQAMAQPIQTAQIVP